MASNNVLKFQHRKKQPTENIGGVHVPSTQWAAIVNTVVELYAYDRIPEHFDDGERIEAVIKVLVELCHNPKIQTVQLMNFFRTFSPETIRDVIFYGDTHEWAFDLPTNSYTSNITSFLRN